jgi:hypothetical protein
VSQKAKGAAAAIALALGITLTTDTGHDPVEAWREGTHRVNGGPLCYAIRDGKVSSFGGAGDGREAGNPWSNLRTEGLAVWGPEHLGTLRARGLIHQDYPGPPHGLARALDPSSMYVASRWTGWGGKHHGRARAMLRAHPSILQAKGKGEVFVWPVDYGPAEWTGRAVDASPGALKRLGLKTDDQVRLITRIPCECLER